MNRGSGKTGACSLEYNDQKKILKHTRTPIFAVLGGIEKEDEDDPPRFLCFCALVGFDDTAGVETLVKSNSLIPKAKARAERTSSYRDVFSVWNARQEKELVRSGCR